MKDIYIISFFLSILSKAANEHDCVSVCGDQGLSACVLSLEQIYIHLGVCKGMTYLGYRKDLILKSLLQEFPEMAKPLCNPPTVNEGPFSLHPLHHLTDVLLIFVILTGRMKLGCLICTSLIARDHEYFF